MNDAVRLESADGWLVVIAVSPAGSSLYRAAALAAILAVQNPVDAYFTGAIVADAFGPAVSLAQLLSYFCDAVRAAEWGGAL